MMKKVVYYAPLIEVISIEVEQVLATSTTEAGSGWENPGNYEDDYNGNI